MKAILDKAYCRFDTDNFKRVDPCGTVYQLMEHTDDQLDIELGALLVAMISWGSRKVIVPTALHMLRDEMKWHPADFIMNGKYEDSYQNARNNCVYRTLNVPTFRAVCRNLREALNGYATMEQRLSGLTVKEAIAEICKWLEPAKVGSMDKSACKRVCMFVRWMVRKESPDFGLWKSRSQTDLYAVMDVHVCRQTQCMLKNKRPTWKACEELTSIFRSWDTDDPLKYDIALMTLADNPLPNKENETGRRYTDLFIDFDDTLYDTRGNATIALTEIFDMFQLSRYFSDPNIFYEAYWNANIQLWAQYAKGEITRPYLMVERFRLPLSIGIPDVDDSYCLKMSDAFLDLCSNKPGVVDGAHELMDYLKACGYRMHLCSNGFHEVQYKKLKASRLLSYFTTIILSEDAGVNKPGKVFFDYALDKTGAKRESTVMIGDNFYTDITGASNAGLDTIFFNRWSSQFKAPEPVTHEVHALSEIIEIL